MHDPFHVVKQLHKYKYFSLPALEEQRMGQISRLPISIRVMLESLLRNCDGKKVREEDVIRLAKWNPEHPSPLDVPFCVARVILQDFTGVPLLVDLATMRDAVADQNKNATIIEPQVPVDLVIDHSVQVDRAGTPDSFQFNLEVEFERNRERYEFMKWGQEAFETFKVVPPGIGIVHQVNLEHIASVVMEKDGVLFLDTLVGTDSHTTMINGLGVVGWGVGGIEAEAAMLGQPVSIETPEVIGFNLEGELAEGVTATDLTLRITEILRKEKVVGKFVEFCGAGTASLSVADRATIGNMAPEYGATMGFFPVDEKTLDYLRLTGRTEEEIKRIEEYLKAQKLFGVPRKSEIDFTKVLELNLSTVRPCVAGPKRPQDRIPLESVKKKFHDLLEAPIASGGYEKKGSELTKSVYLHSGGSFAIADDSGGTQNNTGEKKIWSEEEMLTNRPFTTPVAPPGYTERVPCEGKLKHGSVVIAAITSCTNTSNPSVMVAAGLLAKKAVEKGMKVNALVKTSLAPGSRVVTDYLAKTGLQQYLDTLGFQLVAYGCTTCIGNSGPLDAKIENAIKEHDIISASVLSGNRNFEARIHGSVKANFLMSPPLVVAYALAGRIDIDLTEEPLGKDQEENPIYLRDLWPTRREIEQAIAKGLQPQMFKKRYANILTDNPVWEEVKVGGGAQYEWKEESTYIRKPPFFDNFSTSLPPRKEFAHMRPMALLGDSVTTDHISPAGAFKPNTPAGKYLLSKGVKEEDFNSYGSRRGNHEVMMRGTFANVRILNKMAGGKEGGFTKLMPEGTIMPIFDACQEYEKKKVPLIIFAGKDYGMGSSRDWAAKGTALLGVRAVVAQSFERIHRSNLIGMGVLPLKFPEGQSWESLGITGDETFSLEVPEKMTPRQDIMLTIEHGTQKRQAKLISCIDTPTEVDYYLHGGILPFVLREILKKQNG
ncbi:MAG: aconitate hydratase [Verrucomicrobia bacterium]|nr:aconitate hydratase [Verrucomicrobiota bacterium]